MKVNEAPEKIYLSENPCRDELEDVWFKNQCSKNDIEYIRKDAFIEKAYEYLSYHLDTNKIDVSYKFEFIEEFRNHMKGE